MSRFTPTVLEVVPGYQKKFKNIRLIIALRHISNINSQFVFQHTNFTTVHYPMDCWGY